MPLNRARPHEIKRSKAQLYTMNRLVPYCSISLQTSCSVDYFTKETGNKKHCVNMLFLPLQSCMVEDMAKAKVLSERTESIPIKKITPVIDEEPL